MKQLHIICILILFSNFSFTQKLDSLFVSKINDTIVSKVLSENRAFEIQLPRSFNRDNKTKYPLIIVMDGDHLFNMVSGTVDYLSYWGDVPENIVVGIKQIDSRFKDSSVLDNINNTPITSTANFYDFIIQELIPYVSKNYRSSDFIIVLGQERTANFINFFLLKSNPFIRGYITISPKFSKNMKKYLVQNLRETGSNILYTVSSSKQDFETIYEDVLDFSNSLDSVSNKNLIFKSLIYENENHYTLPTLSVPKSIRETYSLYKDIDKIEYDSIISKLESSPVEYLKEKYKNIKSFYGLDKKVSMNDFMAIEEFIESKGQFNFYEDLSKYANEFYSGTILPSYYMGRYYEENGEPERAMKIYRSAYNMNEVQGLTKDYLLELADRIQDDFDF
jgi:predicted alpha/beta superfamily hydrolase